MHIRWKISLWGTWNKICSTPIFLYNSIINNNVIACARAHAHTYTHEADMHVDEPRTILVQDEEGSAPSWSAQQMVALWCPWYTLISSPVDMDQSLAVVSEEAAWIIDKLFNRKIREKKTKNLNVNLSHKFDYCISLRTWQKKDRVLPYPNLQNDIL